jgi:DNA transformation protein
MDDFTALCVELFSPLGPVRSRRMFGGQGVYVDGLFIAIIDDGQCFLKTDATTRERFVAAGCVPFCFNHKDGELVETSYFRPPEDAMESPALMLPWARLALEAALRAANAKVAKAARPRKPGKTPAKAPAKKATKPRKA